MDWGAALTGRQVPWGFDEAVREGAGLVSNQATARETEHGTKQGLCDNPSQGAAATPMVAPPHNSEVITTMRIRSSIIAALAALALVTSACGSSSSAGGDLLARIQENGVIRISTDPNYPPYSSLEDGEYVGFDIAVAQLIANALEVEIEWQTPSWDALTAGNWGDRWDMSVGSMAQTSERSKVIDFSVPYYYAYAYIAVPASSTATSLADLAGKTGCVGSATLYESWLKGELANDKFVIVSSAPPADVIVESQETDNLCIEALQAGRSWDFFVQSDAFIDNAITETGTVDEATGEVTNPLIKYLDNTAVTAERISVAFDKSGLNNQSLLKRVNEILTKAHESGVLTALSEEYLSKDYTKAP